VSVKRTTNLEICFDAYYKVHSNAQYLKIGVNIVTVTITFEIYNAWEILFPVQQMRESNI